MSERFKLPVWILPLAMALLVAGLGWWGNSRLRANIEDGLKAQLTTTLNANVTALSIWATNQTRLATSLAEDSEVRSLASAILLSPHPSRRDASSSSEIGRFAGYLNPRLTQLGYGAATSV